MQALPTMQMWVVRLQSAGRRASGGDAEAALEERLTALRRQLSTITRSDRSADTQPKSASPASTLPELTALTPPPCEPTATIAFVPTAPKTLEELGLEQQQIEAIVLKYLLNRGVCAGRQIAEQLGLLFSLMEKVLFSLKADQLVVQKGAAPLSDYVYQLTPQGLEDARRYYKKLQLHWHLASPAGRLHCQRQGAVDSPFATDDRRFGVRVPRPVG